METKRSVKIVDGILPIIGLLASTPWLAAALTYWALGANRESLPLLVLVVGLAIPLIVGLPFLGQAGKWLRDYPRQVAAAMMAMGGLWLLAGPLSALNLLYTRFFLPAGTEPPLAIVLAGTLPPLIGLAFLRQAVAAWPEGRVRLRRIGGWAYLAGAAVQALLGVVAWAQGDCLLLLSWLAQASLLTVMAASLFEQRTQAMGAFFVVLGLATALLFIPDIGLDQVSTLVLNPPEGMVAVPIGSARLPAGLVVAVLASFMAGLGAWQAVRQLRWPRLGVGALIGIAAAVFLVLLGMSYELTTAIFLLVLFILTLGLAAWQLLRSQETNGVLGAIIFLFLMAFLIWAARGQSFNFTGMLISTLEAATPIALGALSGVWCERSAVINIAIEGMMLSAAFTAVVISSATDSLLLGLLAGVLTGALLAALLAVLAIRFKVNQIIAGTAINILATGATSFLSAQLLAENQSLNSGELFPRAILPVLSRIPVIGPVFFQSNLVIYLMLVLVVITHLVLFYTRWGLRSRSVGEHPLAADTLGVNVIRIRYINVIIGGLIAGLGGVYFTMASVNRFDEVMTAGRGFIGLAAMIFGRWTPVGSFGSSLIFGFASSLQMKMGLLNVPIPSHFLLMAPYLATMIILAGVVGRAVAPAADGEVYEKH